MQITRFWIIPLLAFFLFSGAGCLNLGGTKSQQGVKDGGVYKSIDGAAKWSQSVAFPSAKGVGSVGTTDVLTMTFDPSDTKTLYMGTKENGLLFSYDNGVSWQYPGDSQLKEGGVRSIAVDPADICTVYAVSGTRLYKTETCSRRFQSVYQEARSGVSPRRVALDWYQSDTVYLGLSNGDILKSTDRGVTWLTLFTVKGEVTQLVVSHKDSRILLVGTGGGLFKSVDAGVTWTKMEEALKPFKEGEDIFSLVQSEDGSIILAATKYGLLRSKDVGDSWEAVKLVTAPGQVIVRAVAMNPTDPQTIYYATSSTFYTSIDSGVTWKTQKLPSSRSASILLVNPEHPEVIYLGVTKIEK
ncbi:MAG: hypothetical protein UU48_C0001G0155 [Candidatus Uhrbacteria bacterium GW2011_GWF2_41_16]|uniref:Sortilin N-terminal domain-containing protein n=2 Tax=Candidatus Uhriibacteriota TaxID=1752732 RepID=A0A0G0XPR2_9BACT|nr:MAG: hypothetical protein UU31_C0002G0030 [Candidatus Uhrbacteria bacterium GW2011_GWA2_41_10]KKR87861.1 MAG: hypothetical protein UU35_C0001G0142 [Candidatus Uhrbacteria bacterium GW2011_GWC2_41_11]KKR98800.1 MAG: hypothetical protein UU48_C0001G0155 [Candidatus Uhrbacteria bacterium GW2011_GWF2_41_16]HBP00357.1 hypothetical protein [Candidatus Uhrbacteria bacterium]